jgi:hypothetical protein
MLCHHYWRLFDNRGEMHVMPMDYTPRLPFTPQCMAIKSSPRTPKQVELHGHLCGHGGVAEGSDLVRGEDAQRVAPACIAHCVFLCSVSALLDGVSEVVCECKHNDDVVGRQICSLASGAVTSLPCGALMIASAQRR